MNAGGYVNGVYVCWYWSDVLIVFIFVGICRCGRSYAGFDFFNFLIRP